MENVNIVKEFTAMSKLENNEDPFKNKYPEGWEHAFILETKERTYRLFSNDYSFKELFIYTLKQMLEKRKDFLNKERI